MKRDYWVDVEFNNEVYACKCKDVSISYLEKLNAKIIRYYWG